MDANTFLKEFQELLLTQPRYNLKQVQAENCDYADTAVKSKNCYYSFGTFYCEDVYYSRYSRKCTDCCGVTLCVNCERCVECVDCSNCFFVSHSKNCKDCSECNYCEDCYGCKDCFGCVGLYKKRFCLFNEQLSEDEYKKWMAAIDLSEPQQQQLLQMRIEDLRRSVPNLAVHLFRTESCVGDQLSECHNCYECYDAFLLEDCLYTVEANANKDCCDLTVCFETELCYSCVQSPLNYDCNFLVHCDLSESSEFCAYSKRLKNCFGCVYLAEKQFHILNKEYGREDYQLITNRLKRELSEQGKYNLTPFFVSGYEQQRLRTETDSAISPMA